MKLKPLSIEELDAYLTSDSSPENCMGISDLDGMLTAIVVGPEFVHPEEWLGVVWGSKSPKFRGPKLMDRAIAGIVARYNDIGRQLSEAPERFGPLYWRRDDGTVIAMDWAQGFFDGMKLRMPAWLELLGAPEHKQLLLPILVHCCDERGDSLMGLTPEQEDILLADAYHHIPEAVAGIRAYFMPRRAAAARAMANEI